MKRFPPLKSLFFGIAMLMGISSFSQIQFKLHWMESEQQWGVFAKLEEGVQLNPYTIVGSGQVTVVAPKDVSFTNLQNYSGEWQQNAVILSPEENPAFNYISFGLASNYPEIILQQGEETLLFTFANRDEECPISLALIENDDPMAIFPNSANANAGNDLSVMDPVSQKVYNFTSNYMPEAWNCHPGQTVALGEYRKGKQRYKPRVAKP